MSTEARRNSSRQLNSCEMTGFASRHSFWPRGGRLLHRNSVWARWSRSESTVEINVQTPIQFEMVFVDFYHMDVVIPFEVDLAEVIFIKKVIGHHQPLIVVREDNRMRSRVHAEVDNSSLERMFGVAHVEHANLTCLKGRE